MTVAQRGSSLSQHDVVSAGSSFRAGDGAWRLLNVLVSGHRARDRAWISA